MRGQYRPGLDWFRLIAAFLVVANHTSPLLSFDGTADFVLTRVLARLAVPFFLMVSGYFVFSRYAGDERAGPGPFLKFLRGTALLYGVAIVLYLPLTIYNGSLLEGNLAANIAKALFFNGTFYHLWYLPAALIGGLIVWLLLKAVKPPVALGIALALYVVGLLGDSYYGAAQAVPALNTAYDALFIVFDYTRNGFFLAPVFLVMGAMVGRRDRAQEASDGPGILTRGVALAGFLVTLGAMVAEGLLLDANEMQRHDSMYILLLPCLFFLFRFLLTFEGRVPALLRPMSMAIYIIHPMVIVLVRGGAKVTGTTGLFVENSLIHYIAVCAVSFGLAYLYALIARRWKAWRASKQETIQVAPAGPGSRWTYRP